MSALLIAPAASARYWTNKLNVMLVLAAIFGMLSGMLGVMFSTMKDNMPTGPWIVFALFIFTLLTLLFAPKKGWFSIQKRNRANGRLIAEENILKIIYQLKENGKQEISFKEFLEKRSMDTNLLEKTIKHLINNKLINSENHLFSLSEAGEIEAARIVRSHRLWELYLTKRMNFKDDHIHGTAETIEHLITPEIEKELVKELNFPTSDPHNKEIPYA